MYLTRNQAYVKAYRGFESLLLRQDLLSHYSPKREITLSLNTKDHTGEYL